MSELIVKKPKQEEEEEEENGGCNSKDEQEEALVALIEHRTKEVQHLRQRISYYKSQLEEAEKRLEDSQSKLARLRCQDNVVSSRSSPANGTNSVKVERRSISPVRINEGSSRNKSQSRTELLIPAVNPKISEPIKSTWSGAKDPSGSSTQASPAAHSIVTFMVSIICNFGSSNFFYISEQKEHRELIPLVRTSASPATIHCHTSNHVSSLHKRKLRSLSLNPVNEQLFVTSALDGVIRLWQLQSRGSGASLLSTTDCLSPKHRRWPEDIAWHPQGNSLFSAHTADSGDSQISVLNLNKTKGRACVTFLDDKPHVKGIINSIIFLPWENPCFATGGSDHAVVLWSERDAEDSWKPKALHRNLHSSAVMGVAGMQQKQIVLSAGADKRIIGFDAGVGRADFKHQIESKCMSVLPNPCDFNLFMVQTGTPGRQLRLYDIRLRQTEIHAFGWKQESSESQSALINQSWSPDGLYITSGSADPVIHLFDIRFKLLFLYDKTSFLSFCFGAPLLASKRNSSFRRAILVHPSKYHAIGICRIKRLSFRRRNSYTCLYIGCPYAVMTGQKLTENPGYLFSRVVHFGMAIKIVRYCTWRYLGPVTPPPSFLLVVDSLTWVLVDY
ncbi:WD REPEATS REGION domain-containing protein [Citrus sinensis]|uniref:WD REPEATS REGION domain-containing protein n=1 Tax=Citrus sinensis TaxID=2711 RepID=A0ACB8LAF6_CITSI|nr:WD REPEATS REGION domain-containing protein [Citrus sinensis]